MRIAFPLLQFGMLAVCAYMVPENVLNPVASAHAQGPAEPVTNARPQDGFAAISTEKLANITRDAPAEIALCAMLVILGSQLRRRSGIKDVAS